MDGELRSSTSGSTSWKGPVGTIAIGDGATAGGGGGGDTSPGSSATIILAGSTGAGAGASAGGGALIESVPILSAVACGVALPVLSTIRHTSRLEAVKP